MPELTLWRLVRPDFAPGLDGKGAERWGGRWNAPGLPAVYCAGHLSLAVLEYFVHMPPAMRRAGAMPEMRAVRLTVPATAVETLDAAGAEQIADAAWCRARGAAWLRAGAALALSVPSAVVPQERNVILNPRHPEFGVVRVAEVTPFRFDPRLGG
jgi:RES domain-containing protein